jgi:outer membrane biosynthesis protein TonB
MKTIINIFFLVFICSRLLHSQNDTIPILYQGRNYQEQLQLVYPTFAAEYAIQGEVNYKFHINDNGCIDSLVIISSPHKVLSEEVKRSINLLKCGWSKNDTWITDKILFQL